MIVNVRRDGLYVDQAIATVSNRSFLANWICWKTMTVPIIKVIETVNCRTTSALRAANQTDLF